MYGYIAEIYNLKEEKDKTLEYLETYLEKAEALVIPEFGTEEEKVQYEKVMGEPVPTKGDLIKQIKNRIEYVRTH